MTQTEIGISTKIETNLLPRLCHNKRIREVEEWFWLMNNGPAVPNGDMKLAEPRDGESPEGKGTQSTLFRAWTNARDKGEGILGL